MPAVADITMSTQTDPEYFSYVRSEIIPLVPPGARRVLDVGCGTGATSWALKEKHLCEHVTGLELDPDAAAHARQRLDAVYECDLGKGIPEEARDYDLILALDVLEHLIDPWRTLRELTQRLNPGGRLITSIPNIRNFRVLLRLLLLGEWRYASEGLLDRTHLRFFTKQSAMELVQGCDLTIEKMTATGGRTQGPLRLLRKLSLGLLNPFIDFQYLIVARKYPHPPHP